ncbi:membrane bound O-acyl transferase MBOAT family protein [endosymbiont of Acanthamoeba sp. UWC8]|nr:membrane bound O-acyl transferase MBOAT family protein [endosymbiont of Acanthamoeba sp. UWC8]
MLFNSYIFLIFITLFFLGWSFIKKYKRLRLLYICINSFVFYGWWDWRFLFLIITSGLIDYIAGLMIYNSSTLKRKKFYLYLSLAGNLISLSIFKYSVFIAENIEYLAHLIGINLQLKSNIPPFMLILPVGISFYTFQSISYSIDIYKRKLLPTKNIIHFFTYLSLFPQLVAGPIVRATDLLPALLAPPKTSEFIRYTALKLVILGYFKKVFIADNIAPIVNQGFSNPYLETSFIYWWVIIILFAIQIYCDFSGYSDIASGLIKLIGYRFKANFNHPYLATSLRDFWKRWHISLSTWFQDYVYIPLGGSKVKESIIYRNIFLTMILSGMWHGASWNFIAWGMLHAFFLSLERVFNIPNKVHIFLPWPNLILRIITFSQILIGWVFFRAQTIGEALHITSCLFTLNYNKVISSYKSGLFYIVIFCFMEAYIILKWDSKLFNQPILKKIGEPIFLSIILAIIIYFRGAGNEFIYFQF